MNEHDFEGTLVNLLGLMGRLADSDDKRLSIRFMTHDMQNIRVELDSGSDYSAGDCTVTLMESDGAALRVSTQGADPVSDYRDFGLAGDCIDDALNMAVRSLLPKLTARACRDTTRNMEYTLKMFGEAA